MYGSGGSGPGGMIGSDAPATPHAGLLCVFLVSSPGAVANAMHHCVSRKCLDDRSALPLRFWSELAVELSFR